MAIPCQVGLRPEVSIIIRRLSRRIGRSYAATAAALIEEALGLAEPDVSLTAQTQEAQ